MKKVLFIISHTGSDSNLLVDILNQNPRIDIKQADLTYKNPGDLDALYELGHKVNTTAAIYGDQILVNPSFACESLYKDCKFIYFIREAKGSLGEIIKNKNIYSAINHYTFRLRRIYEMARKTPGAVFLTRENLENKKGLDLVSEYLELKRPLENNVEFVNPKNDISQVVIDACQERYEYYWYQLSNMDLKSVHGLHNQH